MSTLNSNYEIFLAEKLIEIINGQIWLDLPELEESKLVAIRLAKPTLKKIISLFAVIMVGTTVFIIKPCKQK